MGHYLQDNSRGIYTELAFRPIRGLQLKVFYSEAKHGPDHEELGTDRIAVVDMFLDTVVWKNTVVGVDVNYQIINDVFIFAGYNYQHNTGEIEKYSAPFFRGKTNTFSFGINYGF
jgi:predicted porin